MSLFVLFCAVTLLGFAQVRAGGADGSSKLQIFITPTSMTIHVEASEPIYVGSLQFQTANSEPYNLRDLADILDETEGKAQPDICLVFRQSGTSEPLPSVCPDDKTFRRELAPADIFWYDPVANRQLDVIVRENQIVITTCSSVAPKCTIAYPVDTESAPASLPPLPTLITGVGPCKLATTGYINLKVRDDHSTNAPSHREINPYETYNVVGVAWDATGRAWYLIYLADEGITGYVAGWLTHRGGDCSAIPQLNQRLATEVPLDLSSYTTCALVSFSGSNINARKDAALSAAINGHLDGEKVYDALDKTLNEAGEVWYLTTQGWVYSLTTRESTACVDMPPAGVS